MGRGPHQADATLFAAEQLGPLRCAVADLGWLFERGYVDPSASKLVGDRYGLRQRQRVAVSRSSASSSAVLARRSRCQGVAEVRGASLAIDAFNVVIGLESALGGGVVLRGADGTLRDLASVHGSYRRVEQTAVAISALADALAELEPAAVCWYVDRPVSNSGRLASWLREAAPSGQRWSVETPHDADVPVREGTAIACSSDANILDRCGPWFDLLSHVLASAVPQAWLLDLRQP